MWTDHKPAQCTVNLLHQGNAIKTDQPFMVSDNSKHAEKWGQLREEKVPSHPTTVPNSSAKMLPKQPQEQLHDNSMIHQKPLKAAHKWVIPSSS
jgi:hypothetical protein